MALDTLLSQSHGAQNYTAYVEWTFCSVVVLSAVCVPLSALLLAAEPVLLLIGEDAGMARDAAAYVRLLVPGLSPGILFIVGTKNHLQSQHILRPGPDQLASSPTSSTWRETTFLSTAWVCTLACNPGVTCRSGKRQDDRVAVSWLLTLDVSHHFNDGPCGHSRQGGATLHWRLTSLPVPLVDSYN